MKEGIDVAVRIGNLADSNLLSRRLSSVVACAYASPDYLQRRGVPKHPDELIHHDCVGIRQQESGQLMRWPFKVGTKVIEILPLPVITVDASDGVAAVLVAGGGIGMSATYIAEPYVARGELVPVLAEFAVERAAMTALWPESRRCNPNVRAFLAFLTEIFPSSPSRDDLLRSDG